MDKQRDSESMAPEWQDKMEQAWPYLRAAVWQRVKSGEALDDLVGVVSEVTPGPEEDEESLTVGVLTRDELAETISQSPSPRCREWLLRLRQPAPSGCIYVFGSLGGLPRLWTMGPVAPTALPN